MKRCPKCNADIAEVGFIAMAKQAYQKSRHGFFAAGVSVPMDRKPTCVLCDAELPWSVEDLLRREAA